MLRPNQVNTLPVAWALRLATLLRTIHGSVVKKPQTPAIGQTATDNLPSSLTLKASVPPGHSSVLCLTLTGELNRHTCATLIESALLHYSQGRRSLLLNLEETTAIELSGLLALLNIARLYSGQPMLDPEIGWQSLREAIDSATPALGERVKLLAPSPQAVAALERVNFGCFLERYADLESAIAAFPNA